MKRRMSLLIVLTIFLSMLVNFTVCAESETGIPVGRQFIVEENIGSAVVTSAVEFDENEEIILGEEIDPASVPMPMASAGETCLITPHSQTLWYGNWSTCKFDVKTSTGTNRGYCAQPQKPTPVGYYTVSKINGNTEVGKKLKIALMFGENGPWYSESVNLFGGCPWSQVYAYLHAMISIIYSGQTNGLTSSQVQAMKGAIEQQYKERGNLSILNNYTAYVAYNDKQDIVWLEKVEDVPPKGTLTLKKKSANPELTDNYNFYSLAGAQYGVYQDAACSSKIGTLTTDANGNSNTLSLTAKATYYVKEITAPKGYELDKKVYSVSIAENQSFTLSVVEYPQSLPSIELNILKRIKDSEEVISGTIFRHTLPDGSIEEVTTDENGRAIIKEVIIGKHMIEEIFVPEGFILNPGKVTFEVSDEREISVISNTSKDESGNMTLEAQGTGSARLIVDDVFAPYSLRVIKVNEEEKKLQGAEFSIYTDVNCTQEKQNAITDDNGNCYFGNLEVGKTYYLKETKPPQGYRIMEEGGKGVVYEIRAESNPVENLFECYVNDEKCTEISGTKAERVVDLSLVNYSGIEMPETGTHTAVVLFICGIGCMIMVLLHSVKNRKDKKKNNEKKY